MEFQTHQPARFAEEESALRGAELLTAEEAARLLRVARKFVYAHASALGGWRLLGDRGPWRFSRRELLERRPQAGRVTPRPSRAGASAGGRQRTRALGAPVLPAEPRREARQRRAEG